MSRDIPIKHTLLGNLDKDSDPRNVKGGDYMDAMDIVKQDDEGHVSGTVRPTKRNKHAFSLGSVSAQNKRYRVTVDGDANKSHKLRFLNTKRDRNIVGGTGDLGEVEFNGTISSLTSAFNNSQQFVSWLAPTSGNSIEFEMTSYGHYQWYLQSTGDDDVSVVCIQEAIPTNLVGPLKDIGDYDLLGDLFIFSTTTDNEPEELVAEIIGVGQVVGGVLGGPLTTLTFNSEHGLQAGQWIRITNSNAAWLNGTFVVNTVDSSTGISIVTDTAFGATHPTFIVGSEVVTIYAEGIGEIGVARKDDNTELWTYTRLLRSVELNFVSKKAIRTDARVKGNRKIVYYTDKYNRPRAFSYGGEFITDGALSYISSENNYAYDNIAYEALIFGSNALTFDTKINYVGQSDSGGELLSGNKYYVYRFNDSEGSKTNWSNPTRAIPVFPRSLTDDTPLVIKGGSSTDPATTKAVNLELVDIPQGVYDSVDIAVIESDDLGAISGSVFLTEKSLNSEQSVFTFQHTGLEEGQVNLDVGELAVSMNSFSSIDTVGDLAIIDKRLVAGDISYTKIEDLKEFTKTFKHELKYKEIRGINTLPKENIGGYTDPKNVFQHPSLILNETYAVGADFVFTDGSETPTFWVDTIKVDTSPTNTANPTDNRRVANGGLPHYALQLADDEQSINVPYISFSNIDLNYLVNGVPLSSLISTIKFRFAKIEKEIIASGFVIMGVSGGKTQGPVRIDSPYVINQTIKGDEDHHFQYLEWTGDYEFASTLNQHTIQTRLNGTRFVYPNAYTPQRRSAFFYSPEISMGNMDDYQLQAADKINILYPTRRSTVYTTQPGINYNQARQMGPQTLAGNGDRMLPSLIAEMLARPTQTVGNALDNSTGVNQYDISDAKIMESGQSAIIGNQTLDTYNKENSEIGEGITSEEVLGGLLGGIAGPQGSLIFGIIGSHESGADQGLVGSGRFQYDFETAHSKCLALRTDTDMLPFSSGFWESEDADFGVYYAQLERTNPGKHSDIDAIEYQPYSQSYSPRSIVDINTELDVFGGDAFIAKTLLRNRFSRLGQEDAPHFTPGGIDSVADVGRHLGMSYFTQTYMNMELVSKPDTAVFVSFPESFTGTQVVPKLREWTDYTGGEYTQFYNSRYSYGLQGLTRAAYSEDLVESIDDVPTRVIWSSRDIYSSKEDSMRLFLPLNIFDLDGTFGPVEVVANVNGELFTLQPRKYSILPFNVRGQLETTSNSAEVLLKSGSVLSTEGRTLSFYGTEHKWSAVVGRSKGGKDVLYWFNVENGVLMRFGADGTKVLSVDGMISTFANDTKWVNGKNEHAYDQGVRAVWDDRFKEAIWTFYGVRVASPYVESGSILVQTTEGAVVSNPNAAVDSFEEIPRLFRATTSHINTPISEPGVGVDWTQYWEQIPYSDTTYYSIFTIAYNELTGGFSTEYNHIPKTYLKIGKTFLSSHPTDRSELFEHRVGYDDWYSYNGKPGKPSEAFIEPVINALPEASKKYIDAQILSTDPPYRIELVTKNQKTHLESGDFERNDDGWRASIKEDTTVTNDPTADGDSMFGSYIRVKLMWANGTYNRIYNIIVKVRERLRRYTV